MFLGVAHYDETFCLGFILHSTVYGVAEGWCYFVLFWSRQPQYSKPFFFHRIIKESNALQKKHRKTQKVEIRGGPLTQLDSNEIIGYQKKKTPPTHITTR